VVFLRIVSTHLHRAIPSIAIARHRLDKNPRRNPVGRVTYVHCATFGSNSTVFRMGNPSEFVEASGSVGAVYIDCSKVKWESFVDKATPTGRMSLEEYGRYTDGWKLYGCGFFLLFSFFRFSPRVPPPLPRAFIPTHVSRVAWVCGDGPCPGGPSLDPRGSRDQGQCPTPLCGGARRQGNRVYGFVCRSHAARHCRSRTSA
jgi:hypothetical protein